MPDQCTTPKQIEHRLALRKYTTSLINYTPVLLRSKHASQIPRADSTRDGSCVTNTTARFSASADTHAFNERIAAKALGASSALTGSSSKSTARRALWHAWTARLRLTRWR